LQVSVKWEVITEDELNANKLGEAGRDNPDVKPSASGGFTNDPMDLGLDLSDDEVEEDGDLDSEENSRLSAGGDDSRLSDSNTEKEKSSPAGSSLGPTQFSREMFSSGPVTPARNTRQDQATEARMLMTHLQSKKKDLEHNIATCPNKALKDHFLAELQSVLGEIKGLESVLK